jgi:hypothetical protein
MVLLLKVLLLVVSERDLSEVLKIALVVAALGGQSVVVKSRGPYCVKVKS